MDALSSAMLLAAAVSALGLVIAVTLLRGAGAKRPGDASKRREAAAPAAPAAEIG